MIFLLLILLVITVILLCISVYFLKKNNEKQWSFPKWMVNDEEYKYAAFSSEDIYPINNSEEDEE